MSSCYHEQVHFSDPVFPDLAGESAKGMWKMLCSRSNDLRLEFKLGPAKENGIEVNWLASYTFTKTGRPVKNRVKSHLLVANGKIISHRDHFSFWRWSSQALGLAGIVLGWSPFLKSRVRREAARGLARFLGQ